MRRIVIPVAITLFAMAVEAHAEPSDTDRATARALAREGYEAEKREQFALAADRFGRAEALVHAPTLLLGLARAQAGMGKVVEASETYRRILREPLDARAPEVFVKAVADARREIGDAEKRLAWVTVVLQGPAVQGPDAQGPGAPRVKLDEAPLGSMEVGVPVVCNPGSHVVSAAATGFQAETRTFSATEASRQTITIDLRADPAAAAPAPVARQEAPAAGAVTVASDSTAGAAPRPTWRTPAEVAAFSVGGASLLVGGAAGIFTLVRHHALEEECPGGHCSPGSSDALSTYRAIADVSTAALIVGAVGVAAGITLVATTPRSSTAGSTEAYAEPFGAGVRGTF
jgi:hypothetical protein